MKLLGGLLLWGVIATIFFRWYNQEQRDGLGPVQLPGRPTTDRCGAEPMSERRTERQSLLLPILMPVGLLAVIGAGAVRVLPDPAGHLAHRRHGGGARGGRSWRSWRWRASWPRDGRSGAPRCSGWCRRSSAGMRCGGWAGTRGRCRPGGRRRRQPQTVRRSRPARPASVDGFSTETLAVGADAPIELEFDNEEAGVQHNVVIFDGEDDDSARSSSAGRWSRARTRSTYSVAALPEGSYFFHCEIHPTTMVGEIIAKPGAAVNAGGGRAVASAPAPIVAQGTAVQHRPRSTCSRRDAHHADVRQPG